MINLDKINPKFDFNNFDPGQIVKVVTENQKIVAAVIFGAALVMALMMFNGYRAKDAAMQAQMTQEQGKLDAIKDRETAVNDLAKFKSSIPKELSVFQLITLISNYAKSTDTTITSYSPSPSKDMGLYDEIDVHFDVVSDDFKGMMFFINKIERSKYPIMIDSWSGNKADGGKISFKIAISAVLIHP